MNKKGEEFLVNFFVIIVITFLLFAYFVIFNQASLKTGTTHDRKLIAEYSTHGSLIFTNYLRGQVIVDGNEMEMNDLVAIACTNESYIEEMILKTRTYMVRAQNAKSLTSPPSYNLNWLFSVECKNGEILFAESYLSMIGQGALLETIYTLDKNGDLVKINKYSVLGTKVWFDDFQGAAATYGLVADTHPGLLESYKQSQTYMSLSSSLSATNTGNNRNVDSRDLTYILNELDDEYLILIITTHNEKVLFGDIKIDENVKNDPKDALKKWLLPTEQKPGEYVKSIEGDTFSYWQSMHIAEMRIIAENIYEFYKRENPP